MPSQTDDPSRADDDDDRSVRDDRLRLIFTCCHPALPLEARVALTLRTLAGLTTAEIARAFLVPEPTMAKRLARAKRKIRHAGIPYRVPPAAPAARAHRRGARRAVPALQRGLRRHGGRRPRPARPVRRGHPPGPHPRHADARRARGARPALAHAAARRPAGCPDATAGSWSPGGPGPLPLGRERRSTRACATSTRRCGTSAPGPTSFRRRSRPVTPPRPTRGTDWQEIALLYERLAQLVPSAVVELNRAVAVAMADGPAAGLEMVDALDAQGRWPATTSCPRPAPICCAASGEPPRRATPTRGARAGADRRRAPLPGGPPPRALNSRPSTPPELVGG